MQSSIQAQLCCEIGVGGWCQAGRTELVLDPVKSFGVLPGQRMATQWIEEAEVRDHPEPDGFQTPLVGGLRMNLVEEVEGLGHSVHWNVPVVTEAALQLGFERPDATRVPGLRRPKLYSTGATGPLVHVRRN